MTIDPQYQMPHPGGPMSVQDYLRLDQSTLDAKYEYLDGVARLVSGSSVGHSRIAHTMCVALDQHFSSRRCIVVSSNVQVLISLPHDQQYYVYPDATVSCDVADRRRGTSLIRSPRVVVEVLSPSTEPFDRGIKLKIYQACLTIQEIVLVSQFAPHVVVYRRGKEEDDPWSYIFYGPGATVELNSVDVYLSLDEIYRGIDFDEPLAE